MADNQKLEISGLDFDTIKDNEFLKKGGDINKIDILFDKIERKND